MSKERNVLSQILTSWAQDHDRAFNIASPMTGDEGLDNTGEFFTWLIKNTEANIDMLTLLDRLELYMINVKNKKFPDGYFCSKCKNWYQFAEPNQPDGTLICFGCRASPFH
jgi:hypothetical protein